MELKKIKLRKNRKGAFGLGDMSSIAMVIIVTGIILGIAAYVLATTGTAIYEQANNDVVTNNTNGIDDVFNGSRDSFGDFSDWIPIIVVVSAAAIILGIIGAAFSFGRSR